MEPEIVAFAEQDYVSLRQCRGGGGPDAVDAAESFYLGIVIVVVGGITGGGVCVMERRERDVRAVVGQEAVKRTHAIPGYRNVLGGR